jgi:hypothetical protein
MMGSPMRKSKWGQLLFGVTPTLIGYANFIRHALPGGYTFRMSYLTLEVEIDHGKVVPKEPNRLPQTGRGLLTIFQTDQNGQPRLTPLQALDGLQRYLRLDTQKAGEWMRIVREARR